MILRFRLMMVSAGLLSDEESMVCVRMVDVNVIKVL